MHNLVHIDVAYVLWFVGVTFQFKYFEGAMKAGRNAANVNSLVGGAGTIAWKKLALRIIEHMEMNLHTIVYEK